MKQSAAELKLELKSSSSSFSLNLPAYLDSTMLSSWRACRRKFFWGTLNALHPPGKSIHLIAGGAFAAGMEAARRMAFSGGGDHRPSHDDLLQAAYPAFAGEWGNHEIAENHAKSFFNTFQALESYLLQYPPQEDPIQPHIRPNGEPAVEFTFSIPLEEGPRHPETGDPFCYVGRFDMLGSYNGLGCIVDEKTTSSIGFAWADNWRLRGQFMGYIWACQQLGYDLSTAVIRGIGILKRDYNFATAVEQFPQFLIERWYKQLLQDLRHMVNAYRLYTEYNNDPGTSGYFDDPYPPVFADACTSYGGCAFVPLCSAKDPEAFLGTYERGVWNPLAKNPGKEEEPKDA